MAAYTHVAKHLYYPLVDAHKRSRYRAYLDEAERNQYRSPGELAELTATRLRAIVAHAEAHSPFYRQRFAEHGLRARELASATDLRRFPMVTKADVFEHHDRMVSPVHEGRLFAATTSGSTGIAMRFSLDSRQHAWAEACQWRGRRWWHVDRGDRELLLWSRPVDRSARLQLRSWLRYRLRNYVQYNTFLDFDDRKVDDVIRAIRCHKPRFIFGYGSSIARVADGLARRGEVLRGDERPYLVTFTADHLHPAEREVATRVFAAPVTSDYGASECGGVAEECREGNLHVSVDHVHVEFVRRDGTPAEPDETAEIVLTTLNNLGMPLIRYRIGDLGSFSTRTCRCGVTLPLMTLQAGKAVDLVSTSAREAVSAHVFDYINLDLMRRGIRGIREFLVEQTARDSFVLSVVKEEPFEARAVQAFVDRMKEYLGPQISVDDRVVDDIPLQASGKRRYFKKIFTD